MSATAVAEVQAQPIGEVPAPQPRRPRVLLVGTILAGLAGSMALAVLGVFYVTERANFLADAQGEPWLGDANIQLTPGNMGFVTLLMSAVTASAAGYSLRRGDRPNAFLSLGVTLMLGVAFIIGTIFIWEQLGVAIESSRPAMLIVVLSGAHVVMVGTGMAYLLVMGFRALGGQLTGRAAEGFNAATVFWYITILMYSVVWYAVYITK